MRRLLCVLTLFLILPLPLLTGCATTSSPATPARPTVSPQLTAESSPTPTPISGPPTVQSAAATPSPPVSSIPEAIPTIVYLVRHAEVQGDPPSLSATGRARAKLLAYQLNRARVTHVFSSHLMRTLHTVQPTAADHGLEVVQVPLPGSLRPNGKVVSQSTWAIASIDPMVEAMRNLPPGSVAVAAGHGNTLFAVMAGLGVRVDAGCHYPRENCVPSSTRSGYPPEGFDPDQFDNLWVVILTPTAGRASLVTTVYGEPLP